MLDIADSELAVLMFTVATPRLLDRCLLTVAWSRIVWQFAFCGNCYRSLARWLTLISLFHSQAVFSSSPPAPHEVNRLDSVSTQQAISAGSPPAGPVTGTIKLGPLPRRRSNKQKNTPPVPLQEVGPERVSQDTARVASCLTPPKQNCPSTR